MECCGKPAVDPAMRHAVGAIRAFLAFNEIHAPERTDWCVRLDAHSASNGSVFRERNELGMQGRDAACVLMQTQQDTLLQIKCCGFVCCCKGLPGKQRAFHFRRSVGHQPEPTVEGADD